MPSIAPDARMNAPLFVFGTLRDPDVLAVVLGRADGARTEPATLPGHAALVVAGRDYPVLVPDPDGEAAGNLLHAMEDADRARLGWFEGEAYALVPSRVETGAGPADAVLFAAAAPLPTAGPWRLDDWRRESKAGFLARARRWMAEYESGSPVADSVVWGHGPDDDARATGPHRAKGP